MNKANLLALAALLERKVEPARFSMRWYNGGEENPHDVNQRSYNECGTIACAAGHGPLIFPGLPGEDWHNYVERVFDIKESDAEWNWCFSAAWNRTDNTPVGAAKRIRYMLDNGIPSNAEDQMLGEDPLCYA